MKGECSSTKIYDIAFLGHYTKDTIVSREGTRIVDGGAFSYGSHVAIRMGLRVAAVTRLAREDIHVVEELRKLGVDVFVKLTPFSTCLRLEYPTIDVDERILSITSSAGPFTPEEVEGVSSKIFVIGASVRGEVSLDVIDRLRKKESTIALDLQGFVRVVEQGRLRYQEWPEKEEVLSRVDVVKADAVEAALVTGERNIRVAAKKIGDYGPKEVVLTHKDGLLVYESGRFHEARFFPQRLIGRSGRGDTCIASYMARRLDSSPEQATLWAAAITSLKMEMEGPFRGDIREVDELVRKRYLSTRPPVDILPPSSS